MVILCHVPCSLFFMDHLLPIYLVLIPNSFNCLRIKYLYRLQIKYILEKYFFVVSLLYPYPIFFRIIMFRIRDRMRIRVFVSAS